MVPYAAHAERGISRRPHERIEIELRLAEVANWRNADYINTLAAPHWLLETGDRDLTKRKRLQQAIEFGAWIKLPETQRMKADGSAI